ARTVVDVAGGVRPASRTSSPDSYSLASSVRMKSTIASMSAADQADSSVVVARSQASWPPYVDSRNRMRALLLLSGRPPPGRHSYETSRLDGRSRHGGPTK